jgi:alkyldihydroxyacetonephosphate synthase
MKRWNGWGEESTTYPLPPSAEKYLADILGPGEPQPDVSLESVLASVPPSRLQDDHIITTDRLERLRHARGQSLPDWVAMRSGDIVTFPDGVAYPTHDADVRSLLHAARRSGTYLIPYGGGSSVLGHINPLPSRKPVLCIDMGRIGEMLDLDETSQLATFGAGVSGPALEAQLNPHGYTLGHFPQSFEFSTLGGWIATRSSGQQSYHYGRIEHLFAGGHIETPIGPLDLPSYPASAAGPDLRQLILGSEGRMGVITRAEVRIQPLPEVDSFHAVFFNDWESGVRAVREIAQSEAEVSMLRLSEARETETTLALSGKDRLVGFAKRGLGLLGYRAERCLLILAVTGTTHQARRALRLATAIARANGGLPVGTLIGKMWRKSRFLTPYLRNTLWERGYALDTVETAVPWRDVLLTAQAMLGTARHALEPMGENVLAFLHLSHLYRSGASLYLTFLYRRAGTSEETLARWQILKEALSETIVAHGGTISHQHGVGIDHIPYLPAEKGVVGMPVLESARRTFDPQGLLNPGKLIGPPWAELPR